MAIPLQQYLANSKIRDEIYIAHQEIANSRIEETRWQIDDLLDNWVGRIIPTQKWYHDFD